LVAFNDSGRAGDVSYEGYKFGSVWSFPSWMKVSPDAIFYKCASIVIDSVILVE
jgi:hypothetical protein